MRLSGAWSSNLRPPTNAGSASKSEIRGETTVGQADWPQVTVRAAELSWAGRGGGLGRRQTGLRSDRAKELWGAAARGGGGHDLTHPVDRGGGEGHTVEPYRGGGEGRGRGDGGTPWGTPWLSRAKMGPSTVGAVALLALFFDVADGAYGLRRASVQSPVSASLLLPTGSRARPGGSMGRRPLYRRPRVRQPACPGPVP